MAHYNKRVWDNKINGTIKKDSGYQDKLNDVRYYSKRNEFGKAQALLDELFLEYPSEPGLIFAQAKIYQAKGDIDKSEHLFTYLMESNADNATTAKYELARLYSHSNRMSEAKNLCKELLKEHYKADLVTYTLGNIALMGGNMSEARAYFIKAAPTCSLAQAKLKHLNNKNSCSFQNDLIEGYEKKFNTFNKGIIYWNQKIRNDILNNNIDLAVSGLPEYEKNINKNFSDSEFLSFMDVVLLAGQTSYARKIIDKYKSYSTEETTEYLNGRLCLAKGELEESKEILKNIKEDSQCFCDANYYLGMIAKEEQSNEVAYYYFKTAAKNQSMIGVQAIEQMLYMDIEKYDFSDATIQANKLKSTNNAGAVHVANQALEYISCNKENPAELETNSYSFEQMKQYDVVRALKHIRRHQDGDDNTELNSSSFNKEADVREVYDYALDNLFPSNLCYYDFCHHYVIYYPNVGHINETPVDYVEVVTLPVNKYGVRNILTMYPVKGRCNELSRTINEENCPKEDSESKPKVKELSTIDKFNKRYGFK